MWAAKTMSRVVGLGHGELASEKVPRAHYLRITAHEVMMFTKKPPVHVKNCARLFDDLFERAEFSRVIDFHGPVCSPFLVRTLFWI